MNRPEVSITHADKRWVARSFSRAADHYDQVAHLQWQTGQQLLQLMPNHFVADAVALDIGCGTGKLTRELKAQVPRLIALDFAPGMLRHARTHHGDVLHEFVCADADALPFSCDSLDLIFSNFVLQWSACLPRLLQQLALLLKPEGWLLFSLPVAGTLQELRESWRSADQLGQHVNEFFSAAAVQQALDEAGLIADYFAVEKIVVGYDSVRELTHELKTLGAQRVTARHAQALTGKSTVARMLAAYESYRQADGRLPATWNVLQVSARRGTREAGNGKNKDE